MLTFIQILLNTTYLSEYLRLSRLLISFGNNGDLDRLEYLPPKHHVLFRLEGLLVL